MSKPRLFAKAPDGSIVSRTTHKAYTHAVLVPREDVTGPLRAVGSATWVSWGWTTVPDRMLKDARAVYKRAVVVPVSR
jgi:hypothetical protein